MCRCVHGHHLSPNQDMFACDKDAAEIALGPFPPEVPDLHQLITRAAHTATDITIGAKPKPFRGTDNCVRISS